MDANFKTQLALAAGLAKQSKLDQAIVALKSLDETYDKNEIVLGMLGGIYFQLGMADRACTCYLQVLQINPSNGLASLQLGLAYTSLGKPDDALSAWQALLKDPKDFMGHFHSGVTLLELGKIKDAYELFAVAETNMPENHPYRQKLEELTTTYMSD